MKKIIFLTILLILPGLANTEINAEWVTAKDSKEKLGYNIKSKVLINSKEKLLIQDGKVVKILLYISKSDYKKTLKTAREAIKSRLGEAKYFEKKSSNFRDDWEDRFGSTTFNNWLSESMPKLKSQGINLESFDEARIITERYNIVKSGDGYSQTTIRVINGEDIFNSVCTVIIIKRIDSAKQWGWHNLHNPFSFGYKRRSYIYITNTELDVVNDVERILKVNGCHYAISDALPFFTYVETWVQASECAKGGKEQ